MLKKYILPALNFIVQPLPYPPAAGYHLVVGSSLIWWAHGAPQHGITPVQVCTWCGLAVLIGAVLVGLTTLANKAAGYTPTAKAE